MGSGASKAARAARKYPSPSNIPHQPAPTPHETVNPPLSASQLRRSADVRAKPDGTSPTKATRLGGLDPKLAARLQELGPVTVPRFEPKIPSKPDETMQTLLNRANISASVEEELQNTNALRKHVPMAIIKEIIKAKERGWDSGKISHHWQVSPSVVGKLDKQIAIPVDNSEGVVHQRPITRI